MFNCSLLGYAEGPSSIQLPNRSKRKAVKPLYVRVKRQKSDAHVQRGKNSRSTNHVEPPLAAFGINPPGWKAKPPRLQRTLAGDGHLCRQPPKGFYLYECEEKRFGPGSREGRQGHDRCSVICKRRPGQSYLCWRIMQKSTSRDPTGRFLVGTDAGVISENVYLFCGFGRPGDRRARRLS